MRVLRFIVEGQRLRPDHSCDFNGLIAGTQGYLHAQFRLSEDWNGCKVAVSFWRGKSDDEYAVALSNGMCAIPAEALTSKFFGVSLTGIKNGYRITTNRIHVPQEVS